MTIEVGLAIAMSGLLLGLTSNTEGQEYWMFAIGLVTGLMLLVLAFLSVQPRSRAKLYFKVPAIPLLPCLSIFVNTYLMFQLNSSTWIQFAVWMGLGWFLRCFRRVLDEERPLKTQSNRVGRP